MLRELIDGLAQHAFSSELMQADVAVRFEIDRWERTAAHRIPPGEDANAEFVRRACAADWMVCFLAEDLGPGTQEELEAVLDREDVELSIIWCAEREGWPDTPVGRFLAEHREHDVYIDRAGPMGTRGPTVAITRLLVNALLTVLATQDEDRMIHERR